MYSELHPWRETWDLCSELGVPVSELVLFSCWRWSREQHALMHMGDMAVHCACRGYALFTAEEGGQNKLDNYPSQVFTPKIWMIADFNIDYAKQHNWEGFLMETIWTEPSEHAPQRGPWKIRWPMVLLWGFWPWFLSFFPHPPDTGRIKFWNNGFIHFLATLHPS